MIIKRRGAKVAALAAAAALVLAACGDEAPEADEPADDAADESAEEPADGPDDVQIIYASEQEFAAYNNGTADQNAFRNTHVLNQVITWFWFYGPDGFAIPNEEYGTYELVSEDPQTVEYTYHPDATWSDGTPIDCDDLLLMWAANSNTYYLGEDEDGNPSPLFSTSGSSGWEDWQKPDCNDGDKTITVVYDQPYADWEAVGRPTDPVPAHVVAEQGGLTSEEFIEAIRNDDVDALADAADFFNNGWVMNPGELLPEEMIPSSGPYKITEWVAGESITMEQNEAYWGEPPASKTIIFRFLDQDQQAQALDNREVDLIDPQPNPDLLNQLEGMQGVEVETGDSFVYEHLDFNMAPGHYFEDRELREAFAKCVPRELIVENLVRPQNPGAEVLNARNTYSFQPDYDYQIEGTAYENYMEVDIEGARQILEDADEVGLEVRIGYQTPNPRRTNTVELIRDSCNEAGFEIVDHGMDPFFGGGLDEGDFDVALFGWVGSAYVSGTASTFETVQACQPGQKGNNNGCYSSEVVDDLYGQLLGELDVDAQRELVKEIETVLWEDLPTIPLFTHESLVAWVDDVQGIVNNQTQGGVTWNKDEWSRG